MPRQRKRINFYEWGCRLERLGDRLHRIAWKVQDFSWKRRKPYTGPTVTLAEVCLLHRDQYRKDVVNVMLETNEILADLPWQEEKAT